MYAAPDDPGSWGDWYCNSYSHSNTIQWYGQYYTCAKCFICNTPSHRNYSISITIGNYSNQSNHSNSNNNINKTLNTIWFQIQGSIEYSNDESETLTEWFQYNQNIRIIIDIRIRIIGIKL